jgi:hypothetical protein
LSPPLNHEPTFCLVLTMIDIQPCQVEDAATVVALWNAKRLDQDSCWRQADPIAPAYVEQLLALGMTIVLARVDDTPVGFGLWCALGEEAWLVALAADDADVYYELMAAYCQWGLVSGRVRGFAELGPAITTERQRMDALGVIRYTTIGFEPLEPGQSAADRIPRLLRAECELVVLDAALAVRQEAAL